MSHRANPRRFLSDLPHWIRVAQDSGPWIERRHSEEATWNILIYLREEKVEANPRAIQFLHEAYCNFTERQQQELWRAIHAKRGRPCREPDHENVAHRDYATEDSDERDIEFLLVGLCRLTGSQLRWLSKIISCRMGRPSLAATRPLEQTATRLDKQIKVGARANQSIEKRRIARKREGTRLPHDGPYETVMGDAQELFGCSQRTLERAYKAFKERRDDGRVDDDGNYVDVQPLDDEYRESELI